MVYYVGRVPARSFGNLTEAFFPADVQRPLLADVAANYPGRTVEAYVAAIVGNRSYALRRVQ